jgi:hypothetical protein
MIGDLLTAATKVIKTNFMEVSDDEVVLTGLFRLFPGLGFHCWTFLMGWTFLIGWTFLTFLLTCFDWAFLTGHFFMGWTFLIG